ncbi:MAG: type IX secretion system sortase PorU [Ignavibacteriae bacterium]|nr:type IX secretion system sortase PorU [Ignavibacteria bacterium]MBI3364828.1 type IX secretion system sortase PorU [Ignavibacteriota bacterium]
MDIRVLQSDGHGVVVEYVPIFLSEVAETINGIRSIRHNVEGTIVDESQQPGSPGIPIRATTLKLAGMENNTIEPLNVDYEDVPGVMLASVPGMQKSDIGVSRTYSADPGEYAKSVFLPQEIVSLGHVGETRGVVLGTLYFHPFQYNPHERVLRKYHRIVARVTFGPHATIHTRPDDLLRGIALNDSLASFLVQSGTISTASNAAFHNSVLASGAWYKFAVTEDGVYKLSGQILLDAGIPASVDPHTINVYGNGGFEVPSSVTAPFADDLIENAVYVSDNGTQGRLDPDDYLLFYGKGTRGWSYDPLQKKFSHYINHFTETNIYWLTYGSGVAKAMTPVTSTNDPSALHLTSVGSKSFREEEKVNLLASGQEWLGQAMNPGDQMLYVTPLPGLDTSKSIFYRIHLGARSATYSKFTVREHTAILDSAILPSTIIDYFFDRQLKDDILEPLLKPVFADNQSQLRFSFLTSSAGGNGYVDWYEIFYNRLPVAQNDVCAFHAPDTTALAEFTVTGFSNGPVFVFDVTKFDSVVTISNPRRALDTCQFQMQLTTGHAADLVVVGQSGLKTPGTLVRVANQNLHGDSAKVDYIIVTHSDFSSAAERLKMFREQVGANTLRTRVVDIDQIYNEFSGGVPTPVAVRNYLRYVYANSSEPPRYVLLFGDGDYDYRGIISSGPNWIPPWETLESFDPEGSYATDDNFAVFGSGDRVNMGVGRLTARSLHEANTMVDKIIEYETKSAQDPWKIRVTLVADDALAGVGADGRVENDFTTHLVHAETIARDIPALFETRKIYLFDYPTVYSSAGRRKPDVNQALDDQINQGTLILNYSGHGNPRLWAHERVFVRESDFPLLHNKGKYFFLVAATCNFSAFDVIDEQSGGEILVATPDAGAIAVFSATRSVEASQNQEINDTLFRQLFQVDAFGRIRSQRLGDVIYRTKQTRTGENDKKYFLLGDPALRISFPPLFASIDSINNLPAQQIVQLRALSKASLVASVRDSLMQLISSFSGQAQVAVYDADRQVQYTDPDAGRISYKTSGSVLFRGEQSVSGGMMGTTFIVPKDISYGNSNGRVTFYFWNSTSDGAGYSTNVRIGGTDTAATNDTKGPEVELYLDGRGFKPGDVVSGSPVFIADLSDESGINTSGSGVGHRLEMWLDARSEGTDMSSYYKSKQNTYQQGTIEYPLGTLGEGTHKIRLRAWDTYNNPSTKETVFDVITGIGLRLGNVYNFPNPFSLATTFTFEHNQITPIDAEVKIYTVAGRLIQSLAVKNVTSQFVRIPWDGRDRDGDVLANGVYLYKVSASTQDRRFASEALGKVSIVR